MHSDDLCGSGAPTSIQLANGEGNYDVSHPDADKYTSVGDGNCNVSHPDADKHGAVAPPVKGLYDVDFAPPVKGLYDVDFGSEDDVDL